MSQPKLNQTVLYEVIVAEIESLKKTKSDSAKLVSQIEAHLKRLEELYKEPIPVDIKAMCEEHARIQNTLQASFYIPKWLFISLICLLVGLCISATFNYKQYVTNNDYIDYIERAHSYIKELEEQLPKHKTRR